MASIRFQRVLLPFPGAALAAFLALVSPASAQRLPAIPDSLFARLKASHPRLMLTEAGLQAIRDGEAGDAGVQGVLRFLRKRADSLLAVPPRAYHLAGRSLLPVSRAVLERTLLLAFLAQVDRNAEYADRALLELDSASRFPDWGPEHFLDVAEMAAAFAIGYDWLHAHASPAQRSALLRVIKSKAFDPAMAQYQQRRWWVDSKSNWNPVCNGGLALAALAAGNDVPVAKSLLHRSLLSLQESGALGAFAPDGAYPEGIGYWGYASQYLSMLFASLQTALGEEFGLSRLPGLAETGLFPIYCEGPTGRMMNYGDAGDGPLYPYWMSGFALHFKQPLYGWFAQKHSGLHVLDLVWYDPNARNAGPGSLPLSKRFRGPELAVFRGSWSDSNASYLAFKAGNPANEHSHLDAGTFVFDALGKRWALDLGPDRYGLPGYFIDYDDSVSRYTYYRIRAEGQNTLTLNPGMGPDQDPSPQSALVHFDAVRQVAVGDLTSAYAAQAARVLRGVALQAGGRALIQDEILLRAPGEIGWRMHTEASIALAADGRSALLSQGGKRLWVALLGTAAGQRLAALKAEPGPGTPRPSGQDANAGISVLAVRLSRTQQATLALWLVPLREGEAPPSALPAVQPLGSSSWDPGAAARPFPGGIPARIFRDARGLHATLPGAGAFRIRLFDLEGSLLDEMRGRAPGTFDLGAGTDARGPVLLDVRLESLRRTFFLPPP